MKKIVKLNENDLHNIVKKSVKKVLKEHTSNKYEYFKIKLADIDVIFSNPKLNDFFDKHNELWDQFIELSINFNYIKYNSNDYWTPPSGGYAEITDCNIELSEKLERSIPKKWLPEFIDDIKDFIINNSDFAEEAYKNITSYDDDIDLNESLDNVYQNALKELLTKSFSVLNDNEKIFLSDLLNYETSEVVYTALNILKRKTTN